MKLGTGTLLVLADGQKAAFFRNQGYNGQIRLKQLQSFSFENLPSHELGWDRPGRAFARYGSSRSAFEIVDAHEVEEARFLHDIAEAIESELLAGAYNSLVLMAPPKALGLLQEVLRPEIRKKVDLAVPKDYTNTPISDLEEILMRGSH